MLVDRRRGLIQALHPKQRRYYITKHLYYVCVEFGRKKLPSLKIFGKLLLDILFEMGMNDIKIDRCVWYELTVALPMLLQKWGYLTCHEFEDLFYRLFLKRNSFFEYFLGNTKEDDDSQFTSKVTKYNDFFSSNTMIFLLNFNFSSQ